jgi:hypothetical protein
MKRPGSHLSFALFILITILAANFFPAQTGSKDTVKIKNDDKNVGQIKEVVISSKKKVFETDKGKLIFNVQNSATTTGLTAFDILKKTPGVSVGQNDEVLFRGSAGVNIIMDGKMTYLSGKPLAGFRKGMSAEDISKIEILTAPSAEFDASGNAGIINIIPKKNLKKGYAVDFRSSVSKGKFWMVYIFWTIGQMFNYSSTVVWIS